MAPRVNKFLQRIRRGLALGCLTSKTETRPSPSIKHNGSNASAINPSAQCPKPWVKPPRLVVYERKREQKALNAMSSIEKKTADLKRKRAEREDIDAIRESTYENWTIENAVAAFCLSLSMGVLNLNGCEEVIMSDVPLPRDKDGDVELVDAPPVKHDPQPGEKRRWASEEAKEEPSKSARCSSWVGCGNWALYAPQNVIPVKEKPRRYLDRAICLRRNAPQREDDMRPMKIPRPNWYHCRDPPAAIDLCGSEASTPELSPEEPTCADTEVMDGIDELAQLPPPLASESAHMQPNAAPTAIEKAMLAAEIAHNTQTGYEMQEERRLGSSQPDDDTKSDDSSQSSANKNQAELFDFEKLIQRLDIGPTDDSTSAPHGTGTQGAGDAEQVEIEKAPWEEQQMSNKQIKHRMLRMINESAEKLEAMKNIRETDLERRDVYTRISKLMVHWAHIADFAFEKIQLVDVAAGCSSVRYGRINISKIDCAWTKQAAQGGQMFRRIISALDSLLDKSASNLRLTRKVKDFDRCVSAITDRIARFNDASAQVMAMDPQTLGNMVRTMKGPATSFGKQ